MQTRNHPLKDLENMRLWWSISFLLVAGVYAACLMPVSPHIMGPEYSDKVIHFVTYVIVMLWFSQLFQRRAHGRVLLVVLAMGFSIECLQALTPWRSFDPLDMLANAAGAVLGWWMAGTGVHELLFRYEQRWTQRRA